MSVWCFCSRSHLNSGSARVKHFTKSLSFIMTCLIVSSPVCLSVCLRVFSHPLLQRWERWLWAFLRPADSGSFPVPLPTRVQTRRGRETLQMWVWPHWYSTAGLSHEHYRFMMVAWTWRHIYDEIKIQSTGGDRLNVLQANETFRFYTPLLLWNLFQLKPSNRYIFKE